jgi:hypothetical protein
MPRAEAAQIDKVSVSHNDRLEVPPNSGWVLTGYRVGAVGVGHSVRSNAALRLGAQPSLSSAVIRVTSARANARSSSAVIARPRLVHLSKESASIAPTFLAERPAACQPGIAGSYWGGRFVWGERERMGDAGVSVGGPRWAVGGDFGL